MSDRHPEPDLDYLKRVLLEMLAIPSPTGFTDTIVRYVAERLDELGIPFELTRPQMGAEVVHFSLFAKAKPTRH